MTNERLKGFFSEVENIEEILLEKPILTEDFEEKITFLKNELQVILSEEILSKKDIDQLEKKIIQISKSINLREKVMKKMEKK